MLTGVTLACFVTSYGIALLLELSRWVVRMPYRMAIELSMIFLGILTHGLYLIDRIAFEVQKSGASAVFSNWFDWALLVSLGLAISCWLMILRKPESPIGTFLLPLILALIAAAQFLRYQPAFDRRASNMIWPWIHGISLMVGMMLVTFGFAVALMYVSQAWRLKNKRANSRFLRLPSLEYLQSLGSASLFASASCIAIGLVSGVILNLQRGVQAFWLDAGVLFSTGLLIWLAIAFVLQWHLSKRGLERWTAYLNMISFAFMSLALVIVASSPHGRDGEATERTLPVNPSPSTPDVNASAGRME